MIDYRISLSISGPNKETDKAAFEIQGLDIRVKSAGELRRFGRDRGSLREFSTINIDSKNQSLESFLRVVDSIDWVWSEGWNDRDLFVFPAIQNALELFVDSKCLEILDRRNLTLCVSG